MAGGMRPFHLHTLDEIDVAHRIWGIEGVRAILDQPMPQPTPIATNEQPAVPRPSIPERAPRGGFGWGWLRRAPRAAFR